VITALFCIGGYVCGSLPWGYWLVRLSKGVDIRTLGSGNIGATNVWRVFGRRLGLPVIVLDTAKGFVPALVATKVAGHGIGVLAGGCAMLGHWRPLFLRFHKGGKMVATTGGVFLGVAPIVGGIGAGVWLLVFGALRYASVASMVSAVSLPLWAWLVGYPWPVIAFGGAAGLGVVFLHQANIGRLARREESRFELRRRRGDATRATSP
jgi:acyl phosphate:glycerol-3-phosphate acyltransferase